LTLGTGSTSHFQSQTFNHFLKIPVWAWEETYLPTLLKYVPIPRQPDLSRSGWNPEACIWKRTDDSAIAVYPLQETATVLCHQAQLPNANLLWFESSRDRRHHGRERGGIWGQRGLSFLNSTHRREKQTQRTNTWRLTVCWPCLC
jgi:hypothetical protein